MTWQTTLLAAAVILWAFVQYGLAFHTLRDLGRRPRVRGNNKVVWALVILGIPIVGALIYTIYGPTSFLRQDRPQMVPLEPLDFPDTVARVALPTLADDEPPSAEFRISESPPAPRRPRSSVVDSTAPTRRSGMEERGERTSESVRGRDNTRSRPSASTVRDQGGRR